MTVRPTAPNESCSTCPALTLCTSCWISTGASEFADPALRCSGKRSRRVICGGPAGALAASAHLRGVGGRRPLGGNPACHHGQERQPAGDRRQRDRIERGRRRTTLRPGRALPRRSRRDPRPSPPPQPAPRDKASQRVRARPQRRADRHLDPSLSRVERHRSEQTHQHQRERHQCEGDRDPHREPRASELRGEQLVHRRQRVYRYRRLDGLNRVADGGQQRRGRPARCESQGCRVVSGTTAGPGSRPSSSCW